MVLDMSWCCNAELQVGSVLKCQYGQAHLGQFQWPMQRIVQGQLCWVYFDHAVTCGPVLLLGLHYAADICSWDTRDHFPHILCLPSSGTIKQGNHWKQKPRECFIPKPSGSNTERPRGLTTPCLTVTSVMQISMWKLQDRTGGWKIVHKSWVLLYITVPES